MWQTLAALPRTLLRMVSGPLPYVRLCAVGGLGPLLLVLGCAQASEEPGEGSTARPPAPSPAGPTTSVVSELSAEPEPSASQPTTPAAPPPVKPPSWASFGQPRLVASYFEKGKIGPLVLEASGVHRGALICKVTAASGGWDQAMPFVGTGVETLPDLRVWIGDKTGTILGNTLQGYVFLREIDLRPGTPVRVRLEDVDVTSVQTLIDAELTPTTFPLELTSSHGSLSCRALPRDAFATHEQGAREAAERALKAMEASLEPARNSDRTVISAAISSAKLAVQEHAAFVGLETSEMGLAFKRVGAAEAAIATRERARIDAEAAADGPPSQPRKLPSANVRCAPDKPNSFELVVGARPLRYNWATHELGPIKLLFVSGSGDEYGSAFEDFFVDGKEVKDLHATFAPGTTVLVELDSREQRDPYAIVLREGAKRVVLCAGQAKPWP